MPEVKVKGMSFHYGEKSFGKRRGIMIFVEGVEGSKKEYQFDPDPHKDPWYIKRNNQPKFYRAAAEELGKIFDKEKEFPDHIEIEVNDVDYELEER